MIYGNKVYLRPLQIGDAAILLEWENRKENWVFNDQNSPLVLRDLEEYILQEKDFHLDKQWRLMVCHFDHSPIGTADLFDYNREHREVGIGILIADDINRRKGSASEAVQLLTDYCFEVFGIQKINCSIMEENKASLNLFQKLGFVEVTRDDKAPKMRYFELTKEAGT